MNRLNNEKQIQITYALVEGHSIRTTARMCDGAFNTVAKRMPEIGQACENDQRGAGQSVNLT
jgi:hypothetical protein